MTAIITKNGTGVPPSEALQKGELAVDLDGLKLYTSTDGTDVVEVSASAEIPESPFDFDAVGTATQKITLPEGALDNPGEEIAIGVGHLHEVKSQFGDFTYYFKKEGLENIHGNTDDNYYENPIYWMTGDWGNFYWGGESMGSEFHSADESFISELEADTITIGGADQARSASVSGVKDKKSKMDALRARRGFSVKAREPRAGVIPLVVNGKIQADDLVDAEGNSLLGGGGEMPEVIDGGSY